jgi:hypothetical protein
MDGKESFCFLICQARVLFSSNLFVKKRYIEDPGHVDLSNMAFTPFDRYTRGSDDDYSTSNITDEFDDEGAVEILFFREPRGCSKNEIECYLNLGIGKGTSGECCTNDLISRGLCEENQIGRIIINETIYKGEHRSSYSCSIFRE